MPLVQIKHRYTAEVLFEREVTDEQQASGMAMRVALKAAVSVRASLDGGLLDGASLDGASLDGASLVGAKWSDDITINRAPLQLYGLHYRVYILDHHMQIGCELHTLAEWREFDDARIVEMEGNTALTFWRAHKTALLALAESGGRDVVAQATEAA